MSKENLNEEMNTELQVTEGADEFDEYDDDLEKVGLRAKIGNFAEKHKKGLIIGGIITVGVVVAKVVKSFMAGADEFDECDDDLEVIDLDEDTTE